MELMSAGREFTAYGPSHVVVLSIFAAGAVLLVWRGRRQSEARARLVARSLAVLLMAAFLTALVYKLIRPDLATSVPLQLCDIAEVTAAYALWTQRHWAFTLTYYWGLLLSSQALLTPDIGTPREGAPDFPHHLFVTFFTLHVLVVWAAIYLTWGRGMRPRWRDYRFAVFVTLGWVAFTFVFNLVAGTNYGYLNGKPPTASVLDLLGPWPVYLLIEIVVVLGVWALMTWPWERRRRLAGEQAASAGRAAFQQPG
ncbi:TIGR02206 family membrane protein [Mycolicibacterium litorale]|uniref:YwaF family protein n=1 Tax=Mycolicibacterium litorale TaxID=758802 RepID=UPI003CE6BA76